VKGQSWEISPPIAYLRISSIKNKKREFSPFRITITDWKKLNIAINKWRKLNEARRNLNGFKIGADGLSSTVVIKDVSGQEFKTSHNIVVETVLKTVKEVLDAKIAEVEEQINFVA
jgi:hypothetical protein